MFSSTPSTLVTDDTAPSSSASSTSSASDLYHLALSLLDSLTAHASPTASSTQPTSPFINHASSSSSSDTSPFLNSIESRLGPTTGTVYRATKSAVTYLYAGSGAKSTSRRGGTLQGQSRDWSVRGAVTGLKRLVTHYTAWSANSIPGRHRGPTGWQAKLEAASGLRAGDVLLDEDEVAQAMNQVVTLARQAAQAGSSEAWTLLGDLHLVRSPARNIVD